jgi:hypothetical protein
VSGIQRLCNQMALTEAELYVSRGDQIVSWIQELGKTERPGRIMGRSNSILRKHSNKAVAKTLLKKRYRRSLGQS